MKNSLLKLIASMVCVMLFSTNIFATVDNENITNWANKYIDKELNEWALKNNLNVRFDNFNFETEKNMSDLEIKENIKLYVKYMKKELISLDLNKNKNTPLYSITPFYDIDGTTPGDGHMTKEYVAKVETMVPSIGWGYIKQKFKATVGYSKIKEIELIGSSYETGFTIGTWTPNYSYYDILDDGETLEMHMNGTINYLFKALNISMEATFLDEFYANGNKLINRY